MDYLHLDSITKSYNAKILLNNLFISCKTGEVLGLLGRNGSGKSTLLKIIFGTEKADFKFQKINNLIIKKGENTSNWTNYLPQDNFLPKNFTIKTLINLFCEKNELQNLYRNDFIKPFLDKKSNNISGGEKKIIELLMILNTKAKFILLDEPFNGVSPISKITIKKIIKEKSSLKGIIISDHDYLNVMDISHKTKLLHNASLHDISNKEDLIKFKYIN